MNSFMTKTKAKWHLLFVTKPKERVSTFELKSIENIKDFVLFHITKYYYHLKAWSKGDSWCNNPKYPKKYRTLIKAYRLVLKDIEFLEEIKEYEDNKTKGVKN